MKLEHIAISVSDKSEIKEFYYNIFEMKEVRSFILNKALAKQIFNIEKEVSVFLVQKDELIFEIFVTKKQYKQAYRHICISVKNRKELIKKAEQKDYECICIKREFSDLVFIKDKSGNVFEIK